MSLSSRTRDAWREWFLNDKGAPFAFQKKAWTAYLRGESGLVHAPTGFGKTLAVYGGPIQEWLRENPDPSRWPKKTEPLRVLWLTPLRALANDTLSSLKAPLDGIAVEGKNMPWSVELRTGDTSSAVRQRQRRRFPTVLITTPESLSLLLTHADTRESFADLRLVIVDEWHELISTKRGVQVQLALARLRNWLTDRPLRTWGLSATLGNLSQAADVLYGAETRSAPMSLITTPHKKKFQLSTLVPEKMERFPWAGHLGLRQMPAVLKKIDEKKSTLLFTNTRAHCELWFHAILATRPDWEKVVAIHHGSIDRSVREQVESRLRDGSLKCVVCTSSLDLGVDFSPVDQVIQVGGPKGIARILQRAGRSAHNPGSESELVCVPANAMELIEFSAVREAMKTGQIESQFPPNKPFDVLVQHLVTVAIGGGFESQSMLAEVRQTHAYKDLSDEEWQWVLDFIVRGGEALTAYPQYQRVIEESGKYHVLRRDLIKQHRMSIGTIVGQTSVAVKLLNGKTLGTVEESFIAKLQPDDHFTFSGRTVELVNIHDMTAHVRLAKGKSDVVPQWVGGFMPITSHLAAGIQHRLEQASNDIYADREMKGVKPVLLIQDKWSAIPKADELLIENVTTRQGHHCFVYPFGGRLAHEGFAVLVADRLSRRKPQSFSLTMNDYGFCLTSPDRINHSESLWREALSTENIEADIQRAINNGELAKRRFREIAQVSGLVFNGYPGARKPIRQLQASSGLFFDVFQNYDPNNLLLTQAKREVLHYQLDMPRMIETLTRLEKGRILMVTMKRLSPLSFSLWAMGVQAQVSSESWGDRVRKMAEKLEEEVRKVNA